MVRPKKKKKEKCQRRFEPTFIRHQLHARGGGDESDEEVNSEWDFSVSWANRRSFPEEVPLSSLKERGEEGDSKHGDQQGQRHGRLQQRDCSQNCQAHRLGSEPGG